jgi:hypothetical protein
VDGDGENDENIDDAENTYADARESMEAESSDGKNGTTQNDPALKIPRGAIESTSEGEGVTKSKSGKEIDTGDDDAADDGNIYKPAAEGLASPPVKSPKKTITHTRSSDESSKGASQHTSRLLSPQPTHDTNFQDDQGESSRKEPTEPAYTPIEPRPLSLVPSNGGASGIHGSTSNLIRKSGEEEEPTSPGRTKSKLSRAITRTRTHIDGHRDSLAALVHFDVPEDSKRAEIQMRARRTQDALRRAGTRLRRSRAKDGEIVKMEKMLVRVDWTQNAVPDEFNENDSQRLEIRTQEKWREYMVVCRESVDEEDVGFTLQMYKTRVSNFSFSVSLCAPYYYFPI